MNSNSRLNNSRLNNRKMNDGKARMSIRDFSESLTSNESHGYVCTLIYELDNDIAKKAVRRFLDRWRKNHGHSPKHWLITELGNGRYEHMHIHGLIETDNKERITENWRYGFAHIGKYVNERTCN